MHESGMVGYWATRNRLASTPASMYGRWEQKARLYAIAGRHWDLVRWLGTYLPPECVAPANLKMRSGRPGIRLEDIVVGADGSRVCAKWLLDQPADTVEAFANVKRLQKVVGA